MRSPTWPCRMGTSIRPGRLTAEPHSSTWGALDGEVAAFLEQQPGADGIGHKLSQQLLGLLTTEVVPLANRLAELGIDPTPLFAATSGILRLYADTLERPELR
jgi:hypothetical protein